jgi:hypothetical protein
MRWLAIDCGALALNRADLQQLSEDRILDAQELLAAGRWSGAYHLAGYAVECGLKSCILSHLERTGMLFRDRNYLRSLADCWTQLDKLVSIAGLTAELGIACEVNPVLAGYWGVAKDWNETSRYEHKTQTEAEELLEAITNDPNEVLSWIRIHW